MPTEVIDALAGLNVAEAVAVALVLFVPGATAIACLARADHLIPEPVERALARLVEQALRISDLAWIALIDALLWTAAHLNTTPRNGGTR